MLLVVFDYDILVEIREGRLIITMLLKIIIMTIIIPRVIIIIIIITLNMM